MLGSGTTLNDRYRLTTRLGGGGMGEVWRADDAVLGRAVAVKVLLPALMEDPRFAQRFQNEARAMATLAHPGVVDVYDCGTCELGDGRRVSFLVMEFIDGESLDRLLRRSALTSEETMRLVAEVADALAAAHEHGIVHRDVKPANLMIRPDGSVTLTDFGIAHSASGGQLTATGTVLCSAGYCAPEQASAGTITPAVDIYALGVVAYQCLTGKLPFDGETPVQIIFKHLRAPVPPLPDDVPPGPRVLVGRALEKDPERRWPSASDMAAAARHAAAHPHASIWSSATPPSTADPSRSPDGSGRATHAPGASSGMPGQASAVAGGPSGTAGQASAVGGGSSGTPGRTFAESGGSAAPHDGSTASHGRSSGAPPSAESGVTVGAGARHEGAGPVTALARAERGGRRRALVMAAATMAALIATLAAVGWTWFRDPEPLEGVRPDQQVPLPVVGRTAEVRLPVKQDQVRPPTSTARDGKVAPSPTIPTAVPTTPRPSAPGTPPASPPQEPTKEPTPEPSPEPTTQPSPQEPTTAPTSAPPTPDPQTGTGEIQCIRAPCP
ncbi:serine/threonine-protein kinase [Nonomuraea africana]|uniref:serine/threonine-protein kinase n=1 Tax=Nonomuraea africana TaxID=46171 RepID=UPI0034084F68